MRVIDTNTQKARRGVGIKKDVSLTFYSRSKQEWHEYTQGDLDSLIAQNSEIDDPEESRELIIALLEFVLLKERGWA